MMLTHDKLQETHETETTTEPTVTPGGRRRWLAALLAAGTVAGAATIATVAGPGADPDPSPEAISYDVVEANRTEALRDLVVSAGAHDVVEANRTAALRDLVVSAGAHDVVEANRTAALRDLMVSAGS